MNLVIFHSTSKKHICKVLADGIEGDHLEIKHTKKYPKSLFCQMIRFGYETVFNKEVLIEHLEIDFEKYTDIYLVAPVWAGRVDAYLRQFLNNYTFKEKKIHVMYNAGGEAKNYLDSIKPFIDQSNTIVETKAYTNGILND